MTDLPIWINNPKYDFIKIANPGADDNLHYNKDYNEDISTGTKRDDVKCTYKSCETLPQTVCRACNGYVCENHIYRHPDCEDGR